MRPNDLIKRFRGDQARAHDVIVAKDARIQELEGKLAASERDVVRLIRNASGSDVDRVGYLTKELERRARWIDQLREGVVDDGQTAELRRQVTDLRTANRALEARLAELQADNDGISARVEVAA